MIVLTTSTSSQSIRFVPRSETYNTMVLTCESTGVDVTVTITSSSIGEYYHTINASFTLLEGNYYSLNLKQNSTIVWKSKIYCTDQTDLPNYTIQSGGYTSNTSNNEYVIL